MEEMKDCLGKEVWMSGKQGERVQDRSEWRGFVRGSGPGDKTQTLKRCHSCGLSQLYEACWWKSVCGQAHNLKGVKGKFYFFSFLS